VQDRLLLMLRVQITTHKFLVELALFVKASEVLLVGSRSRLHVILGLSAMVMRVDGHDGLADRAEAMRIHTFRSFRVNILQVARS